MKRKDVLINNARLKVAKSLKFDTWWELVRFRSEWKKTQLHKVANDIYLKDMPLEFAGWWVIKRNKLDDFRPFPEPEDLEEFLNQDV